jgi:hypothetical protein
MGSYRQFRHVTWRGSCEIIVVSDWCVYEFFCLSIARYDRSPFVERLCGFDQLTHPWGRIFRGSIRIIVLGRCAHCSYAANKLGHSASLSYEYRDPVGTILLQRG